MLIYLFKRIAQDKASYAAGVLSLSVSLLSVVLYPRTCPAAMIEPLAATDTGLAYWIWRAVIVSVFFASALVIILSTRRKRSEERKCLLTYGASGTTMKLFGWVELMLYLLPALIITIGVYLVVAPRTAPTCIGILPL